MTAGNVLVKSIFAPPVERSSFSKNPKNKDKVGIKINIIFFEKDVNNILYYLVV